MRKSIADMTLKYDYRNESYSGLLYAYTGIRLKPYNKVKFLINFEISKICCRYGNVS